MAIVSRYFIIPTSFDFKMLFLNFIVILIGTLRVFIAGGVFFSEPGRRCGPVCNPCPVKQRAIRRKMRGVRDGNSCWLLRSPEDINLEGVGGDRMAGEVG